MKNHIIAFGSSLMLGFAGFVLSAQDTSTDPIAARLAAQRLAESGGAAAVPAADASATNTADAGTATATDTGMTNATDTGASTNAAADPEAIARKARLAAAEKELAAAAKLPGSLVLLQNITQKNIFDPRRQPWAGERPPVRQVAKENVYYSGATEKIGKGFLATFEGNGVPSYPPSRCVGDTINGFKIKDITLTNVTVIDTKSTNNAEQVWNIPGAGGQQGVTRDDNGPWKPAYYTPEYATYSRQRQADAGPPAPNQFPMTQPMMADTGPVAFTFGDTSGQDNSQGYNQRNRNRNNGGGGGRGGRGGGGFGGFGGGNANFAPPAPPPDPNAPIDPAVLARLRAQRAAEGQ